MTTQTFASRLVIVPGGYYLEFPDGKRVGRLDGSPFATLAEARDAMDHIENMQRMQASTPSNRAAWRKEPVGSSPAGILKQERLTG